MKMTVNGVEPKFENFPDGQPHVRLGEVPQTGNDEYDIVCSLRDAAELLRLMLVAATLRQRSLHTILNLRIAYLLGARMDRAIDQDQPFTMQVIANILNTVWFDRIEVFNAHSQVATDLLRAENILPVDQIRAVRTAHSGAVLVSPDAGAYRWQRLILDNLVQCAKVRDSQTGRLSGFQVLEPERVRAKDCIILDDLCDGGGTFVGLSLKLKEAGARKLILYVSHGIFSKGFSLANIDEIWTTDSYYEKEELQFLAPTLKVLPCF